MKKAHPFITGSRFDGALNEQLHCMEGFGVYVYPDGTEYRGYFLKGRFHGYGRLKLGAPYKFTFKGVFDDGWLTEIESMTFSDGLRFDAEFEENQLNTDNWRYCCAKDRRFSTELRVGMEPVGPNSLVTRLRNSRKLSTNMYDTEEGIYRPDIGFISDRPPPFKPFRFVGCRAEAEMIMRTCRKWDDPSGPVEPDARYCHQIIDNNLKSLDELAETPGTCHCNRKRFNFMQKLLRSHNRSTAEGSETESSSSLPVTPSTRSVTSLSDASIVEDVEADIEKELRTLKVTHRKVRATDTHEMMEHRNTAFGFGRFGRDTKRGD